MQAASDRLHTAVQTYVVAMARSGERQVFQADVGIRVPKLGGDDDVVPPSPECRAEE